MSKVGIIAEDNSDVNSLKVLIERIIKKRIGVASYVGKGSGKLIKKCGKWSQLLYKRNCTILIVIHDSDFNPSKKIYQKVLSALGACLFSRYLICIPVQELEAWFLSDPAGLAKAFALTRLPKINGSPEDIDSPKEYLVEIVERTSDKKRVYINTLHNEIISKFVSIPQIQKKCPSFVPFIKFVKESI